MKKPGILKSLAIILTAAFSSAACAQELIHGKESDTLRLLGGENVVLRHCNDQSGKRVRTTLLKRFYGQDPSIWMAQSTYEPKMGSEIKLRTEILTLPAVAVEFVMEHECSHHKHGDIKAAFLAYSMRQPTGPTYALEFNADCDAARSMREKGYKREDIEEAFSFFPPNEFSTTHPPTARRLQRALLCFDS